MPRVVWVLGSGFSKPLGGPLLYDLLSPGLASLVNARFAEKVDLYKPARDTFARHRDQGLHLWENAEQFLDILDHARKDRNLATLITEKDEPEQGQGFSPIELLWQTACRAIANECSSFCKETLTDGEAWQAYKTWKEQLSDQDLILTFNYDRVPEILGLKNVPLPTEVRSDGGPIYSRTVYKLHGSVNWVLEDEGDRVARRSGRDHTPFLATPGPTKYRQTGKGGLLEPLWNAATYALTIAEVVVFIGYRFPPTDSHALSEILGALGRNKSKLLRLFTVLGPRIHDDDTVRLEQLLARTMRAAGKLPVGDPRQGKQGFEKLHFYDLQVLPLYAQDYMATLNRAEFE